MRLDLAPRARGTPPTSTATPAIPTHIIHTHPAAPAPQEGGDRADQPRHRAQGADRDPAAEGDQEAGRHRGDQVDEKLKDIMRDIHDACVVFGKDDDGYTNYIKGANIAGFVKVADAMLAQGIV